MCSMSEPEFRILRALSPLTTKIRRRQPSISTMASPPTSPVLNNDAISGLQTGATDSDTPRLHADDVVLLTAALFLGPQTSAIHQLERDDR